MSAAADDAAALRKIADQIDEQDSNSMVELGGGDVLREIAGKLDPPAVYMLIQRRPRGEPKLGYTQDLVVFRTSDEGEMIKELHRLMLVPAVGASAMSSSMGLVRSPADGHEYELAVVR